MMSWLAQMNKRLQQVFSWLSPISRCEMYLSVRHLNFSQICVYQQIRIYISSNLNKFSWNVRIIYQSFKALVLELTNNNRANNAFLCNVSLWLFLKPGTFCFNTSMKKQDLSPFDSRPAQSWMYDYPAYEFKLYVTFERPPHIVFEHQRHQSGLKIQLASRS